MKTNCILLGLKMILIIVLLVIVWQHAHWSVALLFTLQYVKFTYFKNLNHEKEKEYQGFRPPLTVQK